jgi:hypothetical protein
MRIKTTAAILLAAAACAQKTESLDQGVAKLRRGDLAAPGELIKLGPGAVRAVEPSLQDPKLEVRRGAVAVLAGLPGPESCRALGTPLADESAEIRGRAAAAYYRDCPRDQTPCEPLLAGTAKGEPSAAAILLSGYCGDAGRKFLANPPAGRTKLDYGPVVPVALAVSVAKLHSGDASQSTAIASAVSNRTSVSEAEFIVQVLSDIPQSHLGTALPLLDDTRNAAALAGAPAGAQPRRICDAAVDAFAARLGLKMPFESKPAMRYTLANLQAAKGLITAKLKQ